MVLFLAAFAQATQVSAPTGMVRLPGHVLPALAKATVIPSKPDSGKQAITLTIVLRRDDQAGFERYLRELYDPHSKNFRDFLTQREIADRFGPSQADYDGVLGYLRAKAFAFVQGSNNRLTITVRGTRRVAEGAFSVKLLDYRLGSINFRANEDNPKLPIALASKVESIAGLSNLAQPKAAFGEGEKSYTARLLPQ